MIRHRFFTLFISIAAVTITVVVPAVTQSLFRTKSDSLSYHDNIVAADRDGGTHRAYSVSNFNGSSPFYRGMKDLAIQAESPFHMSTTDALWVGAGAVTAAAVFATDQSTYNTIKEEQFDTRWVSKVSPVITNFGSISGVGVVGVCEVYGLAAGDRNAQETAYLAAEAFVTSGMWGIVIKTLTGRERPSTTSERAGEWSGPFAYFRRHSWQSISSFDSFPSGHTLTAFSIATVFAEQYSSRPIVPIICYSAASLVALSRITQNAHWLSDVFVGGVLGHLIAEEVVRTNRSEATRENETDNNPTFHISLTALNDQPAVTIGVRF